MLFACRIRCMIKPQPKPKLSDAATREKQAKYKRELRARKRAEQAAADKRKIQLARVGLDGEVVLRTKEQQLAALDAVSAELAEREADATKYAISGVDPSTVKRIDGSAAGCIPRDQNLAMIVKVVSDRLAKALPVALDVCVELLSPAFPPSVRLRAAQSLLDRAGVEAPKKIELKIQQAQDTAQQIYASVVDELGKEQALAILGPEPEPELEA